MKISYINHHMPEYGWDEKEEIIELLCCFDGDEIAAVETYKAAEQKAWKAHHQARLDYLKNFGVTDLNDVKLSLDTFFKNDRIEIIKAIRESINRGMDAYSDVITEMWYNPQIDKRCGPGHGLPLKEKAFTGWT